MSKSKVLVLITGSIAAYKACYLVSKLVQSGFLVKIAASSSALKFVGVAALEGLSQNSVAYDSFEEGRAMDHIHLIRWADIVICVPATANFINKLAAGIGDDLLTTIALAHDFTKPFLIAPAMNTQMYLHPATQKSLKQLREYGFQILETASGVLACGEEGVGKLLDPDLIFDEIAKAVPSSDRLPPISKQKQLRVLLTSGGTAEPIDSVRSITNTSSGKTGAAIADVFAEMGFEVDFIGAKNGALPVADCKITYFSDFISLQSELFSALETNDYSAIIHCAAVADYSVANVSIGGESFEPKSAKLPSVSDKMIVTLKKNPKLISQIRAKSKNDIALLFGFKLSDGLNGDELTLEIEKQIKTNHCDFVIQNDIQEISGDKTMHKYHIFDENAKEQGEYIGARSMGLAIAQIILSRNMQNDFSA
ncbi:MAG: bifunctional phosphopantothenoylcysteine decarboxylase/phosphopantothenate--cysteine ligase CoaBC [Pseudomonadota bacterium]